MSTNICYVSREPSVWHPCYYVTSRLLVSWGQQRYNSNRYGSGFQQVFSPVLYIGTHPRPISPCMGSWHIIHFSLLTSRQFNKKYTTGRKSTNRQTWTQLDVLKSDTIGSQKCWFFFMAADGVMCPVEIANVPWGGHVPPSWKPLRFGLLCTKNYEFFLRIFRLGMKAQTH